MISCNFTIPRFREIDLYWSLSKANPQPDHYRKHTHMISSQVSHYEWTEMSSKILTFYLLTFSNVPLQSYIMPLRYPLL